jgi:hypothetical protein
LGVAMRAFLLILLVAAPLLPSDHSYMDGAMKPFTLDHRGGATSVIDLSFLLDAPAGKHGFARIAGGHLVTGAGKRLRLWGVNITDWSKGSTMLPSKEDAPMWAAKTPEGWRVALGEQVTTWYETQVDR